MAYPATERPNEFQVNSQVTIGSATVNTGSVATDTHSDSHIIGLSNGNFSNGNFPAAWFKSNRGATGSPAGTGIIGKIYDAEDNVARDSYLINTTRNANDERDFNIAAINDVGADINFVTASSTGTVSAGFDAAQYSSDFDHAGGVTVLTNDNIVSDYEKDDDETQQLLTKGEI